jgi:anti-anti-sigma regulatory factor
MFMGAVPVIDLAGAELLSELHRTMQKRGINFRLAETLSSVRETLVKAGSEEEWGQVIANQPVSAVIAAWRDRSAHAEPTTRPV